MKIILEIDTEKPTDIEKSYKILDQLESDEDLDETDEDLDLDDDSFEELDKIPSKNGKPTN